MDSIGIRGYAAALGNTRVAIDQLVDDLEKFDGIPSIWITNDIQQLMLETARAALKHSDVQPIDVDSLFWVSALATNHQRPSESNQRVDLNHFCYSASWLHSELGLRQAAITGIAQQGCAGLFNAIRLAGGQLAFEPGIRNILIVAGDALNPSADRQILFNLISDAACAMIVSRDRLSYRTLGVYQITKGAFWDVNSKMSEIAAGYFPSAKSVVRDLLERLSLEPSEIDWVIPTGIRRDSWLILLNLWGIPAERCFFPEISFGHTIQADSFLILKEAENAGAIHSGQRILLFTFGFGSTWSAVVLEATI
jgi:3-oxoacyl-[acyl-carrier-protein] synthase III